MATETPQKPKSWHDTWSAYKQPKMLAMLALGFASGLPFMMFFSKLSRWLTDAGVEKSTIGFFYWIGLAYAFKFLWAPIVDRLKIPILTKSFGQRRSWMMFAILGTVLGLSLIGMWEIENGFTILIIGCFLLTYSGATLDISIDAWRIEAAENDEQANMAAVYQIGYRFAIILAGFAMAGADLVGWNAVYWITAGVMALNLILVLMIKEPKHDVQVQAANFKENFRLNVIDPFLDIVYRLRWWTLIVFAFVAIYRLSDFTMGVMTQPLYADLGYTKTQVGLITATFGPWPVIIGAVVSGISCTRIGMMKTLFLGAVIAIITNGAFAWLAFQTEPSQAKLFITIGADNFATGYVGTAFIAYMSSLASRQYAATQYALISSAYALFCKIIAGFSGVLYDGVGSVNFFLITAAYGIPAIILLLIIMMFGPKAAKGIR